MESVSQVGDAITVNADVFQKNGSLFHHLYEMPNETNTNETRYKKLRMVKRPEPHQLLLKKVVFIQHIICVS